jgi:hypothetical protein
LRGMRRQVEADCRKGEEYFMHWNRSALY